MRRGLTLIELVLALGLFAMLLVLVFRLIDRSLSIWRVGETRRDLFEQASVIGDLFVGDLRGLEPGPRGDLLVEWVRFDTDADGVAETKWPRLRLVRQASAADVARLRHAGTPAAIVRDDGVVEIEPSAPGLTEVVWLVAPANVVDRDRRAEGVLWRGERALDDPATLSVFAPGFFGTSNRPPAGVTEEVSGGILWMEVLLATQTSIVRHGWDATGELAAPARSWDAWARARPDADGHPWNEAHPGMPTPRGRALLPRRVRIEIEIERAADRERRTRLVEPIDSRDLALAVDDVLRVPQEVGAHVLVDAEWMRITGFDGQRVQVLRAQRGTSSTVHERGALVHFGERSVREATVATYREDWNL